VAGRLSHFRLPPPSAAAHDANAMEGAKAETVKDAEGRTPAKREEGATPFDMLRREIDRVFEDVRSGTFRWPFRRPGMDLEVAWPRAEGWQMAPAMDLVEKDGAFEISAELPGLDDQNVEVKVANNTLTIRGEKREEKEEKDKQIYLSERRYGAFQRSFRIPVGVDLDRIEANFAKGVLTVTLPKGEEAQQAEKKIDIKAG
jgi:HSP20 family protein